MVMLDLLLSFLKTKNILGFYNIEIYFFLYGHSAFPRCSRWLRRRVLCDSSSPSDWARMSQSSRWLRMRIRLCLRGERVHALRKSVGGQRQYKGKDLVLISHSLQRQISKIVCDGGLSGFESMRLTGREKRTNPLCESARGSASAWSSWITSSWWREYCVKGVWYWGWAGGSHPFWGWGSNGCRSLTHSELEEPFLQILFPAESSPLSVERRGPRFAPRCRPRCWNAGVFEQIWVNNLILLSP